MKRGAGLISAHGNSLRALLKHLSVIRDEEIASFEIRTGRRIGYDLHDSPMGLELHCRKDR